MNTAYLCLYSRYFIIYSCQGSKTLLHNNLLVTISGYCVIFSRFIVWILVFEFNVIYGRKCLFKALSIAAALFCRQISYPTSTFVFAFPKYRHLLEDAKEVVPWRSRTRENSKLCSRENLISSSYPACRYICS